MSAHIVVTTVEVVSGFKVTRGLQGKLDSQEQQLRWRASESEARVKSRSGAGEPVKSAAQLGPRTCLSRSGRSRTIGSSGGLGLSPTGLGVALPVATAVGASTLQRVRVSSRETTPDSDSSLGVRARKWVVRKQVAQRSEGKTRDGMGCGAVRGIGRGGDEVEGGEEGDVCMVSFSRSRTAFFSLTYMTRALHA